MITIFTIIGIVWAADVALALLDTRSIFDEAES